MPIIPSSIPSRNGTPLFKFGLMSLIKWTAYGDGLHTTYDLTPGFALPVLVLEKIPTPEQIEQVGQVLSGKVTLGTGDSVTFKFGTPVNGGMGFFGVQTPSPGAGLLQLKAAPKPVNIDDPLGIAGKHANVVTQGGEDYIDMDFHNKIVEKAQGMIRDLTVVAGRRKAAVDRAQEMSTKGKWGRLGEDHLTNALDRIEQLEKERDGGYLLLPGSKIGTQGVELTMAPDGAIYITKNEQSLKALQELDQIKVKNSEMIAGMAQMTQDLALARQEADYMRAQSIGFDARRQAVLGKADNFKALLVEVLDDDWLDTKQAAHARHVARIKALLGRA